MLFLFCQGFRVVADDRRGHGRSAQVREGRDMDHCAADTAASLGRILRAFRAHHRRDDIDPTAD